jgi:uncharacterized protein
MSNISPFFPGSRPSGLNFLNRTEELARLQTNYKSGIHTTLVSPRRWGKSTLVDEAARRVALENKKIKFCFIDLYKIKSEKEFLSVLTREVIKASSTKLDIAVKEVRSLFKHVIPQIQIGADSSQTLSVGFDWKQAEMHKDELFDLPERLAISKGIKFIICIDEFQKIRDFEISVASNSFTQQLRAYWQAHKNTAYCLYGSKRHMMMAMFNDQQNPFYRFGDMVQLKKVPVDYWSSFIQKQFKASHKSISKDLSIAMSEKMENVSFYVQHLAHTAWIRTKTKCTEEIVESSIDEMLSFQSGNFQQSVESLTANQLNFLRALLSGVTNFSSQSVVNKFDLGSPSSVSTVRKSLESSEIIDTMDGIITIQDPLFQIWLRRNISGDIKF